MHARVRAVAASILLIALELSPAASVQASGVAVRQQLAASELLYATALSQPVHMDAFAPAAGASATRQHFEGRLTLRAAERGGARVYVDDYGVADRPDAVPRELPSVAVDLVTIGDALVPTVRGAVAGGHAYWELVLGTGRIWQESGDGEYSRAALPFSLTEVDANCTHNGMLTFVFRADGRISHAAYQVSSETCAYLKIDLWGMLAATYDPHVVAQRARVESAHAGEVAARLARRPIAELARDFPGVDPDGFAAREEVDRGELTTWGVIVDGVLYSGGCPTRAGDYPACEELELPSYSIAKSILAAFALMRLEKLYPGARNSVVSDYVPQCGSGWSDVTFENLLDMASGHYRSAEDHADEDAGLALTEFFGQPTHRRKLAYACDFPRQEPPGRRWVYRTSDTYLLGTAMNAFLSRKLGHHADIVSDLVAPDVWRRIGLSVSTESVRRTRDAVAQPYTGYGLTLLADDVAKLARFLTADLSGASATLDGEMLRAALQLDERDRGLPANADGTLRYDHGFWAVRSALPGCGEPRYVPFMSGYGGISVVLLPNGVAYYYFGDNREFRFRRAIEEAARIRAYCENPGSTADAIE